MAYGSLLQSYTGWNSISGHADGQPVRGGLWADPWVGLELAMITLAALDNRVVTGQGQYIDFSMAEALTASIPETILDFQMNRRAKQPMGNRDDTWAPHGVYPCAGDDRWVAVAVTGDEEWRALCLLIERPELAEDVRFATAPGRRACQDELDTAIAGWTGGLEDYEAMRLLQGAGVPAGPSLDISRVFHGPQLRDGGYLARVETSDGQMRDLPTLPWRFDDGTEPHVTAAPVLGQHNDDVYRDLLGLSTSEIQSLQQSQGIY